MPGLNKISPEVLESIGKDVHDGPLGISRDVWDNRAHQWIRDTYYDGNKQRLLTRKMVTSKKYDYQFCQNLTEMTIHEIERPSQSGADAWVGAYFFNSDGVDILYRVDDIYIKISHQQSDSKKRPGDDDLQSQSNIRPRAEFIVVQHISAPQSTATLSTTPVPVPQSTAPLSNNNEEYLQVVPCFHFVNTQNNQNVTIMEKKGDLSNPGKYTYDINQSLPVFEYNASHEVTETPENSTDCWVDDYFYNSQGQIILARFRTARGIFRYMRVKDK